MLYFWRAIAGGSFYTSNLAFLEENDRFPAFSGLTWPEEAALPRDLPLIIPLGEGYDLDLLAQALGKPPRVALLPALPYG
jgi:hypothetical protein